MLTFIAQTWHQTIILSSVSLVTVSWNGVKSRWPHRDKGLWYWHDCLVVIFFLYTVGSNLGGNPQDRRPVTQNLYWIRILFTRPKSIWEETRIKMRKQFCHHCIWTTTERTFISSVLWVILSRIEIYFLKI